MDTIFLEPDGRGSFTFTFSSQRGEMSGRVNVGTEGPPDRRSAADREQAAPGERTCSGLRIVALKNVGGYRRLSAIGFRVA
jgi:hypothetical protein